MKGKCSFLQCCNKCSVVEEPYIFMYVYTYIYICIYRYRYIYIYIYIYCIGPDSTVTNALSSKSSILMDQTLSDRVPKKKKNSDREKCSADRGKSFSTVTNALSSKNPIHIYTYIYIYTYYVYMYIYTCVCVCVCV